MGLGCHDNTFLETGPTHLMVNTGRGSSQKKMVEIDWENEDHRRCITACLVKATYVLEDEYETEATMQLAPAWWESFHFSRLGPDMFACDCVCDFCKNFGPQPNIRYSRGVVFEYVPPDGASRHPSAPRYIVAFRGTMPLNPNIFGDMRLNLRIVLNKRHLCSRFCEAHERIGELVDSTADADSTCSAVWLTGHSLGASIALEVGREMMKQGFNLPTFLYNPPHVSLEPVSNLFRVPEKAKQAVYLGGSFVKYAMAKTILRSQRKHMVTVFGKLSPWVPELYVHQRDWICNGFINQLELQEKVQKRFPKIIMSAETLACRDLLHRSAMFGSGIKRERLHLLPSARLWKNSSPDENAHELKQWWKPDQMLSSRLYSGLECWPELC